MKMLAAALLPLLWPLAAAQADQGVGGVHLAFVGDDDGNHDGSCSNKSTFVIMVLVWGVSTVPLLVV